ncbi:hypothetical protein [Halalkalibacter oceani]|uniref:Uncharacterized protein n=1 Tax=Halalkalibacter oceani TaxID=1653776 RepID=A0A9X2DUP6_9BACI|nr:hypothetical protein [Halalkalibacter oceani]MCM3715750.1 hypothetical protein [Halalkalibacter oceani]
MDEPEGAQKNFHADDACFCCHKSEKTGDVALKEYQTDSAIFGKPYEKCKTALRVLSQSRFVYGLRRLNHLFLFYLQMKSG